MTNPIFKNKPNEHIVYYYDSQTGIKVKQDFWHSRSNAVDAFIFAACNKIENGMVHVLIIKRSKTMRDEPNKFGVPCGYLDWDETLHEAMIREVYEETSLYLPDYEKYLIFDNNKKPFFIDDDPKSNKRQNVVSNFVTMLHFEDDVDSFPKFIEGFKSNETAEVMWMPLKEFQTVYREWAFNQNLRVMPALAFFNTQSEYIER